ncbi:transcription factor-like protein DPB [Citrus sinensis]|nr:transcription factor-like protein DPB [Citrus sinensis]
MVTGNNSHQEDGDRQQPAAKGGGATRSWGTTVSGQSVSTSGSVGSPSQSMATPASDSTFLRLNHLDIHGDDAGSQGAVVGSCVRKWKAREELHTMRTCGVNDLKLVVQGDIGDLALSDQKEVADELVAEFADPSNSLATPDQQQYDEKNIRRRVYDALNVLMAMDIISKDKKEIQWKGLPRTSLNDIEELKAERLGLRNRIEKKTAYLQELEDQFVGLQNLIQRNERLYSSGNAPSGGVALPFILVQLTNNFMLPKNVGFGSTPFKLHDDNSVLKAMKFCERQQSDDMAQSFPADDGEGSSMAGVYQPPQLLPPPRANNSNRPPTSPPVPDKLQLHLSKNPNPPNLKQHNHHQSINNHQLSQTHNLRQNQLLNQKTKHPYTSIHPKFTLIHLNQKILVLIKDPLKNPQKNLLFFSDSKADLADISKLLMVQPSTGSNDPSLSSPPPTTPIVEEVESDTNPTTPSHDNPPKPFNSPWFTFDDIPKVQWPVRFQEFSVWIDVQMLRPGAITQTVLKELSSRFTGSLRD